MRRASCTAWLCFALAGCGGEGEIVTGAPPEWGMGGQAPAPERTGTAAEDIDAGPPALRYDESDFVEIETQNRDPFRSFTGAFKRDAVDVSRSQRAVVMGDTSIEEMRLIAIVQRGGSPFAMLTDKTGVGYVVKPREYLGRPEVIQVGTEQTLPVQINWQVHRIRDREIVLRRDDPTNPDAPPITRVVIMQDDAQSGRPEGASHDVDDQARRVLDAWDERQRR